MSGFGTGHELRPYATTPWPLNRDLEAVLLRDVVAGLSRGVGELLAHGRHARRNERLVVRILADLPGDLAALLRVDVLLHLLRLGALLELADLLVLVVAVLPLVDCGDPRGHRFANLLGVLAASGHGDGPGSVVALGGLRALALRLLDAVIVSALAVARVVIVSSLAVAGRVSVATRAAHSVVLSLSGAVEFRHGPAGLVHDSLLLEFAERVIHPNAHVVLLGSEGSVVDSVANALLDFVALLNGEADLNGFVLDVFPQLANELSHVKALAVLLVRHDRPAVLVGNIRAALLVGGAADPVCVSFAELFEDCFGHSFLTVRAVVLPSVAVVLGVGVDAATVAVVLVTAGGLGGARIGVSGRGAVVDSL